ncbi:primosomal protein N' [bacterium NHP-B]|nr:primosomal protein N' [bacterium NHP-B]
MRYSVLPATLGLHTAFTYQSDMPLVKGQVVRVPLGKRSLWGLVTHENPPPLPSHKALKSITGISPLVLSPTMCAFLEKVAAYTLSPPSSILNMALPSKEVLDTYGEEKPTPPTPDPDKVTETITLTSAQTLAFEKLQQAYDAQLKPVLFQGVTGSGKTEIYLQWLQTCIEKGGQALVLLPEIALTPQWQDKCYRRFGFMPTLWHSSRTPTQRRKAFADILTGRARIVVGTRSALFLPYPALKAMVVDEEHDLTFKQETAPLYHGRDMAVLRAHLEAVPMLLTSATPSLESLHNARQGKYHHVQLTARFESEMPHFHVLRKPRQHIVAPEICDKLVETLHQGGQSLLFLNRRGYTPFVFCQTCHTALDCPSCAVGVTYHKKTDALMCHVCGLRSQKICSHCGEETKLTFSGLGVEKLEEALRDLLPKARIAIMSSDGMTPNKMKKMIADLENHAVDIVVGTQMVAKGHHFPNLAFVGILDIDGALHHFDFRSHEHLVQLLTQVGGRAGRGDFAGDVWIQTREPDHPMIQSLLHKDPDALSAHLLHTRQQQHLPPFGKMAAVIISGPHEKQTREYAHSLATHIDEAKAFARQQRPHALEVLGPIPAPIPFAHKRFRWRFLVRDPQGPLQPFLRRWLGYTHPPFSIRCQIDIDPYDFM